MAGSADDSEMRRTDGGLLADLLCLLQHRPRVVVDVQAVADRLSEGLDRAVERDPAVRPGRGRFWLRFSGRASR